MMNLVELVARHTPFAACPQEFNGELVVGYCLPLYALPPELSRDFALLPLNEDEAQAALAVELMDLRARLMASFELEQLDYVRQQAVIAAAFWFGVDAIVKNKWLVMALRAKHFDVAADALASSVSGRRGLAVLTMITTGNYE